MKKIFYTCFLLLFLLSYAGISFSKQDNKQISREAFTTAEQMPTFPGGKNALTKYIKRHLQYPEKAMKNAVEGKVVLRFIVGADGTVSNIEVVQSLNAECDKEALSVIERMPKWDPGMQNGAFVSVYYTLPITFAMH
jgi:protein TonB